MSEVTDFDKELDIAIDELYGYLGYEHVKSSVLRSNLKHTIKRAVEKYIIGEHETIIDLANPAYTVGRNVVRQEQRQYLWGNKK